MDAPNLRFALIAISLFASTGASFQTPNFTVTAPTDEIAKQVGEAAENYRRDLAVFWLEEPLPNWSRPCRLKVRPGSMGAGGETKFQFIGNEVLNWDMMVQGSMERIIDSVLPHEINHTIFACHYRRPLPRWADEGAATLFEDRSEQIKQLALLNQVINSDREFIDLGRLLQMKEYPKGYRPMLIMYAEGYALADFLVQQGGRKRYLKLLADGERIGWARAIKENYHHGGVESLEKNWKGWILAGMPKLRTPSDHMLVSAENDAGSTSGFVRPAILDEYVSETTIRLQSPDGQGEQTDGKAAAHSNGNTSPARQSARTVVSQNEAQNNAVEAGRSITSAVFRGLPASEPSAATSAVHRSASFEAPLPTSTMNSRRQSDNSVRQREATSTLGTSSGARPPSGGSLNSRFRSSSSERPGLESTGHPGESAESSSSQKGNHLPQERSLVTGSTPQWAGFPGQKELF